MVYQDKSKTEEELAVSLEEFKDVIGRPLGLSCTNPEFLRRGDCPIDWDIVFFSKDDKPQLLLPTDLQVYWKNVGSSAVFFGWGDTDRPMHTGNLVVDDYFDPVTKRYMFPLGFRYFNKALKAGEDRIDEDFDAFYRFQLAYDP